jgi:Flp pilus assembly protein TadG
LRGAPLTDQARAVVAGRRASQRGRVQRSDRGSATVESCVVLFPVTALMILFGVLCFRVAATNMDISSAAAAAARAASQAGNSAAATTAARQSAAANLAGHGRSCASMTVNTDTSEFAPGGQVAVTVTCRTATADLVGLSVPGSVSASSTAYAVVDTYRDMADPT